MTSELAALRVRLRLGRLLLLLLLIPGLQLQGKRYCGCMRRMLLLLTIRYRSVLYFLLP
jgi:hypothetical protein